MVNGNWNDHERKKIGGGGGMENFLTVPYLGKLAYFVLTGVQNYFLQGRDEGCCLVIFTM